MNDRMGEELTSEDLVKKGANRIKTILTEFWVFILLCIGVVPSHHVRRFFYRISGISIGKGSAIHTGARFYQTNITIGDDSIVGEGIILDGRDRIAIGNHVDIASDVMIYNGEHNVHDKNFSAEFKPVFIHDYVFIGPRAIILPGVTIGRGAVVGAGAVVTKDVGEFEIVGGVPAKPIGKRAVSQLTYKLGRAAWFR